MSQFFEEIQKSASDDQALNLDWLALIKEGANKSLNEQKFPTRKTENWKYTSLRSLEKEPYAFQPSALSQRDAEDVIESVKSQINIADLDSVNLIFVDGFFVESNYSNLNELDSSVECTLFSKANTNQKEAIKTALEKRHNQKKHVFSSLNTSVVDEGVYIKKGKNSAFKKPIRIIHIATKRDVAFNCHTRLLVDVEQSAELTVIEQFISVAEPVAAFYNAVSEFSVSDNAKLIHYRLHEEDENLIHIGAAHFELHRASQLESFNIALGGKIKRIDIDVDFLGEGANAEIDGVYLPKHNQHIDFHTCIEHRVPHCTSTENFRGIIADSAQAVFNGRIHIHPDAQKTLAELSNKNLLLSDKAQINTKPELEIYADDVKCAHGATIAQLNEQSMHYMMTRGISKYEAKIMLSFGFINELLNNVESDVMATYLRPLLTTVFSDSPSLLRHIT